MQAEQAVSRRPDNPTYLRTLGVARYRADDLQGAIRDLERSIKIGGFDARAAFFLAAAHARSGDVDTGRTQFDAADDWMQAKEPRSAELRRFREEAAAALYMTTHKPADASARIDGAASKKLEAAPVKPN